MTDKVTSTIVSLIIWCMILFMLWLGTLAYKKESNACKTRLDKATSARDTINVIRTNHNCLNELNHVQR